MEGQRTLAPGSESAIKMTPTGEGATSEIQRGLTCVWAPEKVRWLLGDPLALRIVSMSSARMPYFWGVPWGKMRWVQMIEKTISNF